MSSVHVGDVVAVPDQEGEFLIVDVHPCPDGDEYAARLYSASWFLGMCWPVEYAGDWLLADLTRLS